MKSIILIICASLCIACANNSASKSSTSQPKSYKFHFVTPPPHASQEDKIAYMRQHYWDKFDFADSLAVTKADTIEMLNAYATFVANFVAPTDSTPIGDLMRKASASKPMFDYFAMLSEQILHDPNSPLRNDELYIAVLEAQLASPYYNRYERMAPEYTLRIVSQNRINHKANNFDYTLASGKSRSLYDIKRDFTLLYINNPGCAMCRDITAALKSSPLICELLERGKLAILAIYPDENLDEWYRHQAEFPKSWINGYDKGCHIERESLYDLRAIPALYLLDRDKRVLIKDSTSVPAVEVALQNATAPRE